MQRGGTRGLPKKKCPGIVPFPEVLGGHLPRRLVPVPAPAASDSPGNGRGGRVLEVPPTPAGTVLRSKAQGWVSGCPPSSYPHHLWGATSSALA